ncbi:MAG: Uncharacterised protein [Opitutia bacterium UBA7350]|nr:MAG: Uncharacterised protein [Opitutae bacterium UBA7350]
MPRRDPVEQLRVLNELLARAAASDPERAEHARRALDFFSDEQARTEDASMAPSVGACARELARLHLGDPPEGPIAFSHWHISEGQACDPLWLRSEIVTRMHELAGRQAALLLVTGLREALSPIGTYWTRTRQLEYQRVCDSIDGLVCAWASRGSNLQVVVI